MSNQYEQSARYHKASRIADVIETFSGTAADVAAMPTEGRRKAEQLALVRRASESTWVLVAEILQDRASIRRALSTMPSTNPTQAFSS